MTKDHRPLGQIKADIDKVKADIAQLQIKLDGYKKEASELADAAIDVSDRERFE